MISVSVKCYIHIHIHIYIYRYRYIDIYIYEKFSEVREKSGKSQGEKGKMSRKVATVL